MHNFPTSKSSTSADLQKFLDNHSNVFETPKGLPPIRDHDHVINLILGSVPTPILPQPTRLTPQQLEEKREKCFATVVIANTLKVISVPRRNYFT